MALAPIMAAIKTVEEALSIASPVAVSVAAKNMHVYKIAPSRGQQLSTMVTFMNWPDVAREERLGMQREDGFTVQVDCLVDVAHADTAADIALALFDEAWAAFDEQREASKRLSQTVSYLTLRAERPMVELIEWGGRGYVGFHIFLDIVDFEVSP